MTRSSALSTVSCRFSCLFSERQSGPSPTQSRRSSRNSCLSSTRSAVFSTVSCRRSTRVSTPAAIATWLNMRPRPIPVMRSACLFILGLPWFLTITGLVEIMRIDYSIGIGICSLSGFQILSNLYELVTEVRIYLSEAPKYMSMLPSALYSTLSMSN